MKNQYIMGKLFLMGVVTPKRYELLSADFVDTVNIFENRLSEYYLMVLTIDLFQSNNADSRALDKVFQSYKRM